MDRFDQSFSPSLCSVDVQGVKWSKVVAAVVVVAAADGAHRKAFSRNRSPVPSMHHSIRDGQM